MIIKLGRELQNNSICCSAAQGCENAVSIAPHHSFSLNNDKNNTFIRCDGYDGCRNITGGIITAGTPKYSYSIMYVR